MLTESIQIVDSLVVSGFPHVFMDFGVV